MTGAFSARRFGRTRRGCKATGLAAALRDLGADRRSVAATEFALVGSVFLLFVLMILDLALQLATQSTLDNAAFMTARQIEIGNITGSNYSSAITSMVCGYVVLIPSCASNIQIYVAASPSQGSAGTSPAGTGFSSIALASASGSTMATTKAALSADYDVILELAYERPFTVGWVAQVFGSSGLLLISATALQTEPY